MDFIRTGPKCYILFFLTPVKANKMKLVRTYSTTRNAPYVHPRLDSILELCQTFLIASAGDVRSVVLSINSHEQSQQYMDPS